MDFEGAQIAAVDADQITTGVERSLQFRFVMRFAQNVEAERSCESSQRHQFLLIERGDNQQDRIGAICSGLHNLKFIDDEILAQAGKGTAGRGFAQIVQRALENCSSVNTDQCGGASALEFPREFQRPEIGANQTFRRRGFFSSAITATAASSCATRAVDSEIRAECAPPPRVPTRQGRSSTDRQSGVRIGAGVWPRQWSQGKLA